MTGLTALSAFYSSSVRQPAPALTGRPKTHTHINSHACHTCSPFQKLAPESHHWEMPGFRQTFEPAPPLLGSIKAAVQWKTCDSVLCVRGAKRHLIHTSLTCCALKRLLSLQLTRLQRETGGWHAFRPKCPRLLSSGVSLREADRDKRQNRLFIVQSTFGSEKLQPYNEANEYCKWRK